MLILAQRLPHTHSTSGSLWLPAPLCGLQSMVVGVCASQQLALECPPGAGIQCFQAANLQHPPPISQKRGAHRRTLTWNRTTLNTLRSLIDLTVSLSFVVPHAGR